MFYEPGAPRIIKFDFAADLEKDGSASLVCSVKSGSSPLRFEWMKDGLALQNSDKLSISTTDRASILVLLRLSMQDIGNYTCSVKNHEGLDSHTSQLTMKSKIERPAHNFHELSDINSCNDSAARMDIEAERSDESERGIRCNHRMLSHRRTEAVGCTLQRARYETCCFN